MANYFPLFVSHMDAPSRDRAEPRRSVFHRFYDAIVQSRRRAADRAIARHIGAAGFNDSVEFEIERRFLSNRHDRL